MQTLRSLEVLEWKTAILMSTDIKKNLAFYRIITLKPSRLIISPKTFMSVTLFK